MTKRKTHDEFVQDVYNLTGDEYTVIGTYTLAKNKLEMKHNICGNTYEVKANNFISGKRCPVCMSQKKYNTSEDIKKRVSEKYEGRLIMVGDYTSLEVKTSFKCTIHNSYIDRAPRVVLSANTNVCKSCIAEASSKRQLSNAESVQSKLDKLHNGTIMILGEYKGNHTKTLFKCLDCDKVFNAEPNAVTRISGCPRCKVSKGEKAISSILNSLDVLYTPQKTFDDCKYKRKLPFDFYIESENLLIEYDGLQHSKPIDYFGGEEAYKKQVIKDSIKTKYAIDNNIRLLRFNYNTPEAEMKKSIKELIDKEVT